MRYPKFLLNAFATLGVFAFIFLACSVAENVDDTVIVDDEVVIVDDDDENPPPPIENNYGKYQMTTTANFEGADYLYTTILNTETGETKLYSYVASATQTQTYTYLRGENLGGF